MCCFPRSSSPRNNVSQCHRASSEDWISKETCKSKTVQSFRQFLFTKLKWPAWSDLKGLAAASTWQFATSRKLVGYLWRLTVENRWLGVKKSQQLVKHLPNNHSSQECHLTMQNTNENKAESLPKACKTACDVNLAFLSFLKKLWDTKRKNHLGLNPNNYPNNYPTTTRQLPGPRMPFQYAKIQAKTVPDAFRKPARQNAILIWYFGAFRKSFETLNENAIFKPGSCWGSCCFIWSK